MSSEEEENYDDESFDEEYEDEFDNESGQESSGTNEQEAVSNINTDVNKVVGDAEHQQQTFLGEANNMTVREDTKFKEERKLDEQAKHEEMDPRIDTTMHSEPKNIQDEKSPAVDKLGDTSSNTFNTAVSANATNIDTSEANVEQPQIPEDDAKGHLMSNSHDNLLQNRDDPNPGGSPFSSAVDLFPFASTSSSILENPESGMAISAYDMFVAKGPHLPNLIMSTSALLEQRKDPLYLKSESFSGFLQGDNSRVSTYDPRKESRIGSSLKRKRNRRRKEASHLYSASQSLLHPHSTYNNTPIPFEQRKPKNVLTNFAVQQVEGGDNWNSSGPDLIIEEIYKRLIACMLVNKLRSTDIFRICDHNDDGKVCVQDFFMVTKDLNLKLKRRQIRKYFKKTRKRWRKNRPTQAHRFKGNDDTSYLSKDIFHQEIVSRNHVQQSRLESRMKTYTRRHARMMQKIRNVREDAVNKYGPKTQTFEDFYDVTRSIPDPEGAKFWRSSFGKTCGKVSLNEFMRKFRKYFNDIRKKEGLAVLRSPTSQGMNTSPKIQQSSANGDIQKQKLSPTTKIKKEKKWILRRVRNLISNPAKLVTVNDFISFLNVFGPSLHSVLDNVIIGQLQSQQQIRSFRYKLRSEREHIRSKQISFSTRTVVHDLSLSKTFGK